MAELPGMKADSQTDTRPIGLLLMEGFSMLSFASAIEPLHIANRIAGKKLYQPIVIALSGDAVVSASGIYVSVVPVEHQPEQFDTLLVCGKADGRQSSSIDENPDNVSNLNALLTRAPSLGGIGTGALWLARSGKLDGCKAVLHGMDRGQAQRQFARIRVSGNLFEVDKQVYTCGGGSAAVDMMLALIARQHGMSLSAAISENLVRERQGQTSSAAEKISTIKSGQQPRLRDALDLMLANIEEPLGADELASLVGISRRQLERLFRKHLDTVPSRHYLQIRLEHARKLLQQENAPVVQVALDCGFANASHFSTAYRNQFGSTPSEERRKNQ